MHRNKEKLKSFTAKRIYYNPVLFHLQYAFWHNIQKVIKIDLTVILYNIGYSLILWFRFTSLGDHKNISSIPLFYMKVQKYGVFLVLHKRDFEFCTFIAPNKLFISRNERYFCFFETLKTQWTALLKSFYISTSSTTYNENVSIS